RGAARGALQPAFAQQPLHALDRVALRVEQVAHPAQQRNVLRPVVAPSTTALEWLELRELRLPEAQHVLRDVKVVRYLADRPERCRGLPGARGQPGSTCRLPRAEGRLGLVAHGVSSRPPRGRGWPLMRALRTWLGRKVSTRRGRMGT